MPNFTAEKIMFTAWLKKIDLVYIANFALYDNCEWGDFSITYITFRLN